MPALSRTVHQAVLPDVNTKAVGSCAYTCADTVPSGIAAPKDQDSYRGHVPERKTKRTFLQGW